MCTAFLLASLEKERFKVMSHLRKLQGKCHLHGSPQATDICAEFINSQEPRHGCVPQYISLPRIESDERCTLCFGNKLFGYSYHFP